MQVTAWLVQISSYFPAVELENSTTLNALQKLRFRVGYRYEPAQYIGMSLATSVAFSLAVAIAVIVLTKFPLGFFSLGFLTLIFPLLAFGISLAVFFALPVIGYKEMIAKIESELPMFLRTTGILMELGIPFQTAIEIAGGMDGADSILGIEVRATIQETKNGMGVSQVISAFAAMHESLAIKRAASRLLSAYEVGSDGSELVKAGDEMLMLERHRLKEYSARSAMFGLLFIMSTAILPTFFLVYAVLGRMALGVTISDWQVALGLLVVFPAVSILILAISKATMPTVGSVTGSIQSKQPKQYVRAVIPAAIMLVGFVLPILAVPSLILGIVLAIYLAYLEYGAERRLEEIERELPDALFTVSSMPKSTKLETIFAAMAGGGAAGAQTWQSGGQGGRQTAPWQGRGALAEEAAKTQKQLALNLKADIVLDDLWQRNQSAMLERACVMMKQMLMANALDRMHLLAEDAIAIAQIRRERSQLFTLQKYTLVFGAFLIPFILRMALHLLQEMAELFDDPVPAATIGLATAVVPPYLVIYATICATAIADAEGKGSMGPVYLVGLILAALGTFYLFF